MISSREAKSDEHERFVSANLAILDGVHLCLLPSSGLEVSGSSDGSSSRRKRDCSITSSQSGRNGKPQPTKCGEVFVSIPALPLSSFRHFCGKAYVPCVGPEACAAVIAKNDFANEKEAITESDLDPMQFMETIRLRSSALSSSNYRCLRSVSLTSGTSSLPVCVSLCDEMEEGAVTYSNEGNVVNISLPSHSNDLFLHGLHDECEGERRIYGGEYDDTIVCDDCMFDVSRTREFEIQGAGSCLVADFIGANGYEQALIAPLLDESLLFHLWDADAKEDELIQRRRKILQTIVWNSLITNGVGILSSTNCFLTTSPGRIKSFTMPFLRIPNTTADRLESSQRQLNDATSCSEIVPTDALAQSPTKITRRDNFSVSPCSSHNENKNPVKNTAREPAWMEAIARTVGQRIAKEEIESERMKRSVHVRSELVCQGRRALHEASRCGIDSSRTNYLPHKSKDDSCDPEVLRLRYGARPRSSIDTCGGVSVVLDLELDVYMHDYLGSEEMNTKRDEPSIFNVVHDFHLSLSLANHGQCSEQTSSPTKPTKIRTVSGLVPTLRAGESVTILASALLMDMKMSLPGIVDVTMLDISIQGLWTVRSMASQGVNRNTATQCKRQGTVICLLRLPVEGLYVAPPTPSAPNSGHWVQHEVDFTAGKDTYHVKPSAIFEYRQPRSLIVDTSGEMNHTQDVNMWKQFVSNLNASIGPNSFVDLYCKRGDPRLNLVIFGSNAEERAATVKLVLCSLPQSAKLIDVDPDVEKNHIKALLLSLKAEIDAFKRHRALPHQEIGPHLLAEMAALQMQTDGVASNIKRGWSSTLPQAI